MKSIPKTPYRKVDSISYSYMVTAEDVLYAIREEYALTIEAILSRRIRLLIFDAKAAIQMAPKIANIVEIELGEERSDNQKDIKENEHLATQYVKKNTAS